MLKNLHACLLNDQRRDIEQALQKNATLLNKRGDQGRTLLLNAIRDHKVSTASIQWLLQYQPDLTIADCKGRTALHFALYREDIELIITLLQQGANINQADKKKKTPLLLAYHSGIKHKIIKHCLQYNPDLNVANRNGQTLLHLAVRRNDIALVTQLMQQGADINKLDKRYRSPFFEAICNRKVKNKMVQHLWQYDPEVKLADKTGCTLLHFALFRNCKELIKTLIEKEVDINQPDHKGETPLFYGVHNQNVKESTLKCLLKYSPNAKSVSTKGGLALDGISKRKKLSKPIVEKLIVETLNADILRQCQQYFPQEIMDMIINQLAYCIWSSKQVKSNPHYYGVFLGQCLNKLEETASGNKQNIESDNDQSIAQAISTQCRLK